jgi:hypothetical protein
MSTVRPDERNEQKCGFAERGYFHRAIAYRAAGCSIELDHSYRPAVAYPLPPTCLLVINDVADWHISDLPHWSLHVRYRGDCVAKLGRSRLQGF